MLRKVVIGFIALTVLAAGAAYAIGNPGAAYATWSRYEAAVAKNDGATASQLVSQTVIDMLARHRQLALTAGEGELLDGSMTDLLGAIRLRAAAHTDPAIRATLEAQHAPRQFVAQFYNHGPAWNTSRFAPTLVLPLGPSTSIAWMGPAKHAGVQTILLSMAAGSRFTFTREDHRWRVDLTPLLRYPANEYDYYSGRTPFGRKTFLNNMYAHNNVAMQQAIWTPIQDWK